jgi:hypothetical protein
MKTLHFKSKEAFRKWTAYGHIRTKTGLKVTSKLGRKSIAKSSVKMPNIVIAGHVHKVRHRY